MIRSEVFDISRFSIMSEAVLAANDKGKILYKNPIMKKLCHGSLFDSIDVPDTKNELVRGQISNGRFGLDFDFCSINLFGEKTVIGTFAGFDKDVFPVILNEQIYTHLRTFNSDISIPVFGGRVVKSQLDRSFPHDARVHISDFEVGYFCLDDITANTIYEIKERLSPFGYKIDTDIMSACNPVCNLSLFDFALVLELLLLSLLTLSSSRNARVFVSENGKNCSVTVEVPRTNSAGSIRKSPETLFSDNSKEKAVIDSIMKFCALYSWKLIAREGRDSLAIAFILPAVSHEKHKFRNEDDKDIKRVIKEATSLLDDEIRKFSI